MSYSLIRSSIIRGPAYIVYTNAAGTVNFYSQGDITVNLGVQTFDVMNSAIGTVDKRSQQRTVEVSFTPVGDLTQAGILTALYPYMYSLPGDSAFAPTAVGGSPVLLSESDTTLALKPTLEVIPKSGNAFTFYGVIVTKQPQLMLSATKTQLGAVTFTAVGKETTLWSSSSSLYANASATYTPPSFTTANVKTISYLGTWGTFAIGNGGAGTFSTRDGFTIDTNVELQPIMADAYGIIDWTVGNVVATASCNPLDVTADQIQALIPLQGTNADRGASLLTNFAADLVITPADTGVTDRSVTIKNAVVTTSPLAFGLATPRIPTLQFTSLREVVSNALTNAFIIT